jgi:hypothetical protein
MKNFGLKNVREETTWETRVVDGKIILEWLLGE